MVPSTTTTTIHEFPVNRLYECKPVKSPQRRNFIVRRVCPFHSSFLNMLKALVTERLQQPNSGQKGGSLQASWRIRIIDKFPVYFVLHGRPYQLSVLCQLCMMLILLTSQVCIACFANLQLSRNQSMSLKLCSRKH